MLSVLFINFIILSPHVKSRHLLIYSVKIQVYNVPGKEDIMFKFTKRSIAAGLIPAGLLILFIAYNYSSFQRGDHSTLTMGAALTASALIFPVCSFRAEPVRDRSWYRFLTLAFFFLTPLISVICVERLNGNFITSLDPEDMILDNYAVCLAFYALLYFFSGSIRISVMVCSPVFLIFGTANMFVKEFKGSPLVPMDVGSIATAASVADNFHYTAGYEIAFSLALTLLVFFAASRIAPPWYRRRHTRLALRVTGLLYVLVLTVLFYGTTFLVDMGYRPDFFNQKRGYEAKGAVLEFMLNTRYMRVSKPSGYDADHVSTEASSLTSSSETPSILQTAAAGQPGAAAGGAGGSSVKNPNIIVVMDEAFSDLRVLGDIKTKKPMMPFIDSLKENTIIGNMYVSVVGTGTSNTEYEFLTGNSMAFLPAGSNAYQLYVKDQQPGLVSTLEAQGYDAIAMHPYFRSNWNRPAVYRNMGFQRYLAMEQLFGKDLVSRYRSNMTRETLRQELAEKYPGEDDILLRSYVSDAYDFRRVEQLYQKRDKAKPWFCFNVTMQNHSPYDMFSSDVLGENSITRPEDYYSLADTYVSLVRRTDDALRQLVQYFQHAKEPTVILFFGDHQPALENGLYEDVMGKPLNDLTDAENQKRYITRFVLWANYDIPEGYIDKISANYMSTLLLQTAGLEMPEYNRCLANLYCQLPVVSAQGVIDSTDQFHLADDLEAEKDSALAQSLLNYHRLSYNNVIDTGHRTDRLFYLGKK